MQYENKIVVTTKSRCVFATWRLNIGSLYVFADGKGRIV